MYLHFGNKFRDGSARTIFGAATFLKRPPQSGLSAPAAWRMWPAQAWGFQKFEVANLAVAIHAPARSP